jgi:cell division inhibitor SepF
MGLGDVWNRTLVYFGIAEDEEWDDEELTTTGEQLERDYRRRERRTSPASARREDELVGARQRVRGRLGAVPGGRRRRRAARGSAASTARRPRSRVHLVLPRSFNDAQQIADRFKDSVPVILNLQSADTELSKRLIDFASGSPTHSTAACSASRTRFSS